MLVFIIPLKSKKVSNCWETVCKLFERTLRSVCNQTSKDFRVIVVHHEKPEIDFKHPNVEYVRVDFDLSKADKWEWKQTDKGRKLLKGMVYAGNFRPSHIMFVDGDDCVSKHLARFVNRNKECDGWFINKGYKYKDGNNLIYLKRRDFNKACGTGRIIRHDLVGLPEKEEYDRGYGFYKSFVDIEKIRDMLSKNGSNLRPLPFPGSVHIIENSENMSNGTWHDYGKANRFYLRYANIKGPLSMVKEILKLLNCKKLTKAIRDEFNVYPI